MARFEQSVTINIFSRLNRLWRLFIILALLPGIASIGSLSVIALERYWLITHSGKIPMNVTILAVFLGKWSAFQPAPPAIQPLPG